MKVRRRPASFPRGRGTAAGGKAGHTGSVQLSVWWEEGRSLTFCFYYLRSERRHPGKLGHHIGDHQHLWGEP